MMDRPRRGSVDGAETDDAMAWLDHAGDTAWRTFTTDQAGRDASPSPSTGEGDPRVGKGRSGRRPAERTTTRGARGIDDAPPPEAGFRSDPLLHRVSSTAEGKGQFRGLVGAIAAPHPLLWLTMLALVLVDAVWLWVAGIRLDPAAPLALTVLVAALLAAAACLGPLKSEPSLRAMALASASLIAFTVPVAILHYCAATLALPLIDGALARAERALGFDWPAYLGFLRVHPDLNWWLSLGYHTSGPQIAGVVIVLAATRRLGRLWAFVRLFCATLLCVVAVSAVLPAIGAYAHYAPAAMPPAGIETVGALWHLDALERLRAGTFDTLVLADLRGLVTFPSFHVCLAVLTAWALAPVRLVGILALVLNAAVIVATLGSGGHYLPDLVAGAAVAFASLCLHHGLGRRHRRGAAPRPVGRAAEPTEQSPLASGT